MTSKINIVIASHNQNKLNEFKNIFNTLNIKNVTFSLASDYTNIQPDEIGETYEENALIKAKEISEITNKITLSDDSGFSVSSINNQPGVYSARWCTNNDPNIAFERIKALMGASNNKRAFFTSVLCIYIPKALQGSLKLPKDFIDNHAFFSGTTLGEVSFPPKGTNGFAYDKIFIPTGCNCTFAEMTNEEKNILSHRYKAILKFKSNFLDINQTY